MLSDTDPLLPSCSEPYQLGLKCVPEQDGSHNRGVIFQNCGLSTMEKHLSSELSPTPRLDRSQDAVDINCQASAVDEKEGCANEDAEKLAEPVQVLRPTSKEFKKTWGFRRTTIAQRETPADSDRQDCENAPVRRSGRQARRACKAEESIPTTKRGRGVRKSAPACLENPKPLFQMPTDAETLGVSVSEGTSSDQADSEELTLKELQDRLKKRRKKDQFGPHRETHSLSKEEQESSLDKPEVPEVIKGMPSETSAGGTGQDSRSTGKSPESSARGKPILNSEEEEELPGKSDKSHCPDTLYCMCRQRHNNRFMICCDQCEEWFHGDCVGITEARGRLLEKNGEDYTCPNCTRQRSQAAADESSEGNKQAWAEESPSCQTVPSTDMKNNHVEDQGIKGKIEKISNPSEKKKMKIFQPVEETSALPKCIGPICGKSALPDSVYCGTECILKHAAAAMKSLTTVKEPTPKPQSQKKLSTKSIPKGQRRTLPERSRRRSLESCTRAEEDESSSEEEAVVERDQTAPLWSSNHNCNTVNPEKTAAIPSAVFYKSSGKESEEIDGKKESPLSFTFPRGNQKTPILGVPPTKRTKLLSQPMSCDEDSNNSAHPPSKCPTSRKRSPALASQPSCPLTSRRRTLDALRLSMTTCNVPSKLPRQQNLPPAPSSAALTPAAPSVPPHVQLNITIRHNIRRSLAEILFKRVSDSDDLDMCERDVGKLAVGIEKEMYNLFLNTDNDYKNKYRSILFNLKDPKNMGLFTQVVRGEVTPFKLVRLSPEELLCKDVARPMLREKAEILEHRPKAQAGQLKQGLKQERSPPVDTEESPPVSEGDTCSSAASSLPCIAPAPDTTATVNPRQPDVVSPVTDHFSKMLKDTTAEHRTHLFNLNCKICTGQMSADETPVPKKVKNSVNKKVEPKTKPLSHNSKAGDYLGDDSSSAPMDSAMYLMESPASPDDTSCIVTLSEPITIPAVPSVVIAGRDPRTASYRPPVTVTSAVPTTSSIFESRHDIMPVLSPASPPPPPPPRPRPIPKSILLKPTSSTAMRFFTTSGSSASMMDSHSPPGGDTALFLSKQEVLWKGFINMHSVAKFVTKAYLVSGSSECLKEDLPDTIHIGGRISPDIVWDYVAKIRTSVTKELCLIRLHPASEEEEVAYISLFSYLNSRGRFGVVANNSQRIKDLYLIPLGAKASIPSKLIPIEGPGLETNHPNLLLGLAICQKPKCSGVLQGEDDEEKCSRFQTGHSDATGLPSLPVLPSADINQDKKRMYNPEILIGTTPPGSPSSVSSSDSSSSSFSASLLLHQLKPVKTSAPITTNSGKESSSPTTDSPITPLQTILKTLFGKNKIDLHASLSPSEQNLVKMEVSPTHMLDPIVQKFGQISEEKVKEDEDNRPNCPKQEFNLGVKEDEGDRSYDPEEEFNPGMSCQVEDDEDDRPYDPEEEYNPGMDYGVDEADRPYDPEEEYNPGMNCGVEKDDRPYDPEEEYNPGMSSGVEDNEDGRPYDPEEEYNQGMGYGIEDDEDERPYDPEEEYNQGLGYGLESVLTSKLSKAFSDDEVAYDPEDETIFEEVKGNVTDSPHQIKEQISSTIDVSGSEFLTLTEQQKMLEELNKQIEEQERQLAEQEEALRQQRAAVGVSLAHFSVSDALMSPPLKPLLTSSELLQLSRKEELPKTPTAPVINQRKDPRQSKDPQQVAATQKLTSDRMEKDSDAELSVERTKSLKQDNISQSPLVTPPESVYLDAGSSEVNITPQEEKIDPGIKGEFQQESALEQKIKKTSEAEIESSPYGNWQNSASVSKDKELSSHRSKHPKHFRAQSESKPNQMPYRSILRNKTSHHSSELYGISPDVTLSNMSMVDTYKSTMSSVEVHSPDIRGPEDTPHSIPFRSSHESSPVQEFPFLQGDHPHFRDVSKFQHTVHCPPYQNQRDEKMHTDNPCRHTPSAILIPRGPHTYSRMGQKGPTAKLDQTRSSLLPNNIGQRGLSPDRFLELNSPPPLDVQNDSHQRSPSFSFFGSTRPHIRQIDNGDPRLSNLHGSRGRPHHHEFMDHGSQKPLLGTPRFADEQQCNRVSYQRHMVKNEVQMTRIYREDQDSSETHYFHPVGEMEGQRFHPPQDFGAPRVPSPQLHNQRIPLGQYRGSFENQNSPQQSKLKRRRGLSPPLFRGPQDDHDNHDHFTDNGGQLKLRFEGQNHMFVERPLRRSGSLLPTPIEGPILLPHHMRNRHEYQGKDWRHSPDTRSAMECDSELHNNGRRTRMFEGYHDEVETQDPSCLSLGRQQGFLDERRRDQDASHSKLWNRNSSKYWNRDQERDCSRGREVEMHRDGDYNDNDKRDLDQDSERDRSRHRDWSWRDGERSRIRDRNKDQECDRYFREGRQFQSSSRNRGRQSERDHGSDKGRDFDWRERSRRKGNQLVSESSESDKHAQKDI